MSISLLGVLPQHLLTINSILGIHLYFVVQNQVETNVIVVYISKGDVGFNWRLVLSVLYVSIPPVQPTHDRVQNFFIPFQLATNNFAEE